LPISEVKSSDGCNSDITYGGKAEITPGATTALTVLTEVSVPALKAAGAVLTAASSHAAGTTALTTATDCDGDVEMSGIGSVAGVAVVGGSKARKKAAELVLTIRTRNAGGAEIVKSKQRRPNARAPPRPPGNEYGCYIQTRSSASRNPGDPPNPTHKPDAHLHKPGAGKSATSEQENDLKLRIVCKDCRVYPPNAIEYESSGDVVCGDCGLVFGLAVLRD
jgi:hypothetical protein